MRKYFTRKNKLMFYYPAKEILENGAWKLYNLSERVRAAEQIGYETHLRWTEQGLEVWYVEKFEPKYF